ncbi:SusC/RagA family TonB-linked outer membrane protein [Bacteroidia bacterium]|nr:SusC/RagA family TonB-linked outer membrane protein [Bacteroidia bacterium]
MICYLISTSIAFAQTKTVQGVVIDEGGEQLLGVNVYIPGTSFGTTTNVNGEFQLAVPQSATALSFKFLGMNDLTVPIKAGIMQIVMTSNDQNLDEIIVVAYGTAKKSSFTGSAGAITSKSFESRPLSNITNAIEGNISGVQTTSAQGQPGEDANLRIRGFGSVNASNTPLYIVDGAVYNGSISSLNSNDIESVTILKDAISTALYGSSAGNGVVLITTKKGTDAAGVNLKISQGWSTRAYKDYATVDVWDYFPLQWQMRKNAYITAGRDAATAASMASGEMVSTLKYNPFLGIADGDIVLTDGTLNPAATKLKWGDDLSWEDAAYGKGYRQEYTLGLNSKSEKSDSYASIGYLSEKGYMLKTDFERYSGRLNYNIYPLKWFKSGINISSARSLSNYSTANSDNNSSYNNLSRFVRYMAPIYPVHKHDLTTGAYLDKNGNPTTIPSEYVYDYEGARLSSNGRDGIAETELNSRKYVRFNTIGRTYVTISPINGLEITANYALENNDYRRKVYENKFVGDGTAGPGRLSNLSSRTLTQTFNQLATYQKSFNNHSIKILAGHENYSYQYEYFYAMKVHEVVDNLYDFENFTDINSLTSYTNNYKKEGYLANFDYDYANRYYLSASYRRDGSSRFHKDYRWGNFYAIGGSWRISEESFINSIEWINNLKLRASYGETGNDDLNSYYPYQTLYDLGENNSSEPGAYFTTLSNPKLKWETQVSSDVALEFGLFKRLTGSVELFQKASRDLLFNVATPTSTGVSSIARNIGKVKNKGVEIDLDYNIVRTQDWSASIGFNATFLKSQITRLPDDLRENGYITGSKKYMEGHSIYDFWLRQWWGVNPKNGDGLFYLDTDAYNDEKQTLTSTVKATIVEIDGQTLTNSYTYAKFDYSGSSIPKVYGGIKFNLGYKSFRLDGVLSYATGGKILNYNDYSSLMSTGSYGNAMHVDLKKAWQKEGDITSVPRLDFTAAHNSNIGTSYSTRWLQSGDYLNFRSIVFTYSVPRNLLQKIQLKGADFSVSAENLFSLRSQQGLDAQSYFSGVTYNDYTPARVITLGLNLTF